MAAHVYWRLLVTYNNGGNAVGLQELDLHSTAGGANVATGGTATASETYSGLSPANAFDGNTSTIWGTASQISGAWIQYQFASATSIVEYAITTRNDSYWNQVPMRWQFQYSDDGTTWTTADNVYASGWGQNVTQTFTVGANFGILNGASVGHQIKGQQPALTYTVPTGNAGRRIDKPYWGGRVCSPAAIKTTVSGTVSELGTAKQGVLVMAYDKLTSALLGTARTASDGTYTIECTGSPNAWVVAFDPTTFQMIGFDQVTPG